MASTGPTYIPLTILVTIKLSFHPRFAGPNGFAGFGFVALGALGFPLVVKLLPFRNRDLTFYPAVFQVHAGGYQGEPLLPGRGQQFIDLATVQQKFPDAHGRVVFAVAVAVLADVGIM